MLSAMMSRYLKTHFVEEPAFIQSAGISKSLFDALIATGVMPGAIYRLWSDGTIWSPIGGWVGEARDSAPTSEWFSPAAIWWARRAAVLADEGLTPAGIAMRFREIFLDDLLSVLTNEPVARLAYSDSFTEGGIDTEKARETGLAEWADWINGGYGVCLRRFDAHSLAVKGGEAARVRQITQSGAKETLSPAEKFDLLDAMERLDAVMLPFAPYQRPNGTPGFWIDMPLARYGLGAVPLVESFLADSSALKCA